MSAESRKLTVALMPLENRWETIQYTAQRADELGYHMFSLPETWSYDITVLMANLAGKTEQIKLGVGIVNVWSRSAASIAMAIATMQIVSNGRFVPGLGASTPQLIKGLHDMPYQAPFTQIRRTLTQVRALLEGQRIPLNNFPGARPLKLNLPEIPYTPILFGALSPRSIELAGELVDGWIPFLYPRDRMPEGIERLKKGRQASANPERPLIITPSLPVSVHEDAEKAREVAAWFVAFYITTMGDLYRETLRRMGFADEVDAVMLANQDRRPAIVPAEAERLLEQLTIYGTPEQARAQLDKWTDIHENIQPGLLLGPGMRNEQISYILESLQA